MSCQAWQHLAFGQNIGRRGKVVLDSSIHGFLTLDMPRVPFILQAKRRLPRTSLRQPPPWPKLNIQCFSSNRGEREGSSARRKSAFD